MHRLGVMHRDLKLDNVIVFLSPGCGPTLKIADFGSARAYKHICDALPLADDNSSLSTDVCTYWYAAVELLLGDHEYSRNRYMEHWLHNRGFDDWLSAVHR